MNADEARAATAPGGPLEFVHAAGVIQVPAYGSVEERVRAAVGLACRFEQATLLVCEGREAVLISRARYMELLRKAGDAWCRDNHPPVVA